MIGDTMIHHWKEIEAVLKKYKVSEADYNKALDAYKGLCWHYNYAEAETRMLKNLLEVTKITEDKIKTSNSVERYSREQWPDEWSVSTL